MCPSRSVKCCTCWGVSGVAPVHLSAAAGRPHALFPASWDVLSLDALRPKKGNRALYVVRELKFGLVLQVVSVLSANHTILKTRVLQPVKALGYRIRGVVSDDERALCLALRRCGLGWRIKLVNGIVCATRRRPWWPLTTPSRKL